MVYFYYRGVCRRTPSMLSQHILVHHILIPITGTRRRVVLDVASQL